MKITLNFSQFLDNWPESIKDKFSYEAKKAIFDYIKEIEDGTGEETEFDPIAICCEWNEATSADEAAKEYFEYEGMTFDPEDGHELETVDEVEAKALKFLQDRTTVLELDNGGVVYIQF